eukprot:263892-Pelagomonas_calceolata.AAC.1
MQCLGQQQDLPAAEHALPMYAWLSARHASCSCHPVFFLSPLRQSSADQAPKAPLSTHQGRGADTAPHRISKLPCLTSQLAVHITILLQQILNIPSQLEPCKTRYLSGKLEWYGGGLQSPRTRPPPGPRLSKGIHKG